MRRARTRSHQKVACRLLLCSRHEIGRARTLRCCISSACFLIDCLTPIVWSDSSELHSSFVLREDRPVLGSRSRTAAQLRAMFGRRGGQSGVSGLSLTYAEGGEGSCRVHRWRSPLVCKRRGQERERFGRKTPPYRWRCPLRNSQSSLQFGMAVCVPRALRLSEVQQGPQARDPRAHRGWVLGHGWQGAAVVRSLTCSIVSS